ncbi:MAG: glycine betaine ABC transporter substrate-binding protein [Desulfococcaceae bacterium]
MKRTQKAWPMFLLALVLVFSVSTGAFSTDKTIRFGDLSWDSVQVHNRIAGFIAEHGYGYDTEYIPGETVPINTGLQRGDLDVNMESWTENIQELYDKGIANGDILDLGPNYPDSWQGWLVPPT